VRTWCRFSLYIALIRIIFASGLTPCQEYLPEILRRAPSQSDLQESLMSELSLLQESGTSSWWVFLFYYVFFFLFLLHQ
jgi:hypothetical protein